MPRGCWCNARTGTVYGKSLTQGERVRFNKRKDTRQCDESANCQCEARTDQRGGWRHKLNELSRLTGPSLLGAGSAAVHPHLDLSGGVRPVERRESAALTGIPAPADQIVGGNMLEELLQRPAAIL